MHEKFLVEASEYADVQFNPPVLHAHPNLNLSWLFAATSKGYA